MVSAIGRLGRRPFECWNLTSFFAGLVIVPNCLCASCSCCTCQAAVCEGLQGILFQVRPIREEGGARGARYMRYVNMVLLGSPVYHLYPHLCLSMSQKSRSDERLD